MRRWGSTAVSALIVAGLMAAASAQGTGGSATLRVGLDADPPNMDPHRSTAAVDRQVYQNLFDKLVDTDENLQIVPMLASAWTISADGKTVTLTLRQGVKFHDGTPFNAEAVKYNFDRMQDPNFPSARRSEVLPVQKVALSGSCVSAFGAGAVSCGLREQAASIPATTTTMRIRFTAVPPRQRRVPTRSMLP